MSNPNSSTKKRNVGFLGVNIFENSEFVKELENVKTNTKAKNSSSSKSIPSIEEQPSFFSKLTNRFTNKCDCSCEKPNAGVSTNTIVGKNTKNENNTNIRNNSSNSSKNCIRLFGPLKRETGYVTLMIKINDDSKNGSVVRGGKFEGFEAIKEAYKMKKEIANKANDIVDSIEQVKDTNDIKGKGNKFFANLKDRKKIAKAVKEANPLDIQKTVEKTGVSINNVSNKISNVVSNVQDITTKDTKKGFLSTLKKYANKTKVVEDVKEGNVGVVTADQVQVSNTSNVNSNEPVIFAIKVMKTQTETSNDVPASILSILDFLITHKGLEFSNVKTIDEVVEAIMMFFAIKEPLSVFDILQHCKKVFGGMTSVSGIKALCQEKSIVTFDKQDSHNLNMNEWDVLMTVYNELINLEDPHIDINIFVNILTKIKEICGNIQNINLRPVNNAIISKIKTHIENQCSNIDNISIKEIDVIKQNFIDIVCSKDDKYSELSKFLIIFFNFFLNDVVSNTFDKPVLTSILQDQMFLNIETLNKRITMEKTMILFVKRETIKEFLSKFEDDNIVITI